MNKWKQAALAVLTVVLLLLGGALPFLAAAVQDRNRNDAAQYGDMDTLELTLRGEEAEPLDLYVKLLMLQTGETVELAPAEEPEEVNVSEEILTLVEKALDDYYAAGLLQWSVGEMTVDNHTSFFLYLPGDPEANAHVWMLELTAPDGGYLGLVMDAETGIPLAMEYTSAVYLDKLGYDAEYCGKIAAEIYFSNLELTPFATEETPLDMGMMQTWYLEKEGYENVMVVFSVQPDGFSVMPSPV